MTGNRRLIAIVLIDVAGYSRLMGTDEEGTLARLMGHRDDLLCPTIAGYGGQIVKTTGDGLLAEFDSVVDAVRCLVEIQKSMLLRNKDVPPDQRIEFRGGVNLGDVILKDGDIFGNGVNVAARLETLAEPGGICVSSQVYEEVVDKIDVGFKDMGERRLKNITHPVRVYQARFDGTIDHGRAAPKGTDRRRALLIAGIALIAAILGASLAAWSLAELRIFLSPKSAPSTLERGAASGPGTRETGPGGGRMDEMMKRH
jgi:class 3 adenylate cyclase